MKRSIILILFFILFLYPLNSIKAGEIKAEILQTKLNRYYFNVGSESYIFKGCNFRILNNSDTIYSGLIDEVYDGVSISEKDSTINDSIDFTYGIIEAADIDSISPIRILKEEHTKSDPLKSSLIRIEKTQNSNIIEIYDFGFLNLNHEKDDLDGKLSFLKSENSTKFVNQISISYSYIVVLIPNLSKEINRNGILTTSLYYRYSKDFLSFLFEGDSLTSVNNLFPLSNSTDRSYEFNSEKGMQLAQSLRRRNPQISFYIHNLYFKKLGNFIGDILNRDKFNVTLVDDSLESDIVIEFIPFIKSNPGLSLESISNILINQSPLYDSQKEALTIIKNNLQSAKEAQTEILRDYYLKLVDYSLKYDLGVFPMFQPTIYFQHTDELTNCHFDENGMIDWKSIVKLKLPPSVTGEK